MIAKNEVRKTHEDLDHNAVPHQTMEYESMVHDLERFWEHIVGAVAGSFNLGDTEKAALQKNRVAKLIGCLPYIAGTRTPERDGCSNTAIYLMSIRTSKEIYFHHEADDRDMFARLHDIMNFNGGNREIIMKGMDLLALMMISDYMRDRDEDRELGKHNPFNYGQWKFDEIRNTLVRHYQSVTSQEIDYILTLADSGIIIWEP